MYLKCPAPLAQLEKTCRPVYNILASLLQKGWLAGSHGAWWRTSGVLATWPVPSSRCYSVVAQQKSPVLRSLENRFFSANAFHAAAQTSQLPVLASPAVGRWLLISSAMVFAVIVVGGVTRLTESGLSITEWKPITGIIPPMNAEEWGVEFEKYKATPEFKLLNHSITLDEFKSIFYMEWSHRVLGRVIGLTFIIPLVYFRLRKRLNPSMHWRLTGMTMLIAAQGLLGWYMVKSGLEDSIMDTPGAVPRVSQYRLAAHLGTAVVLYAGMLGTGLTVIKDWKYANGRPWGGSGAINWQDVLSNPAVKRFSRLSKGLTGLVFLTALSGAFVAGLDAGLLYNEFPLMGGRLAPPMDELFSFAYAKNPDGSDVWWRNIFENPTTVQFDHRVLAMTTYLGTCLLFAHSRRPAIRTLLPPLARISVTAAFAMANVQVLLGLATLLYLVPVPVAAAHQAGSIALLSTMVHLLVSLRRPGLAAQMWRKAGMRAKSSGI
ncbi:COX15-CtaA-domain-containing protein [Rhizopogon vinicolor AM-OR11-026]|uniref:COX15-CtaA-domain-containing protein n=1 Tax=Rhizopogon vinicolor AM-OR11-026 TaxID=1314800 RepID=A0A1B7NDX8_9AGAM|nr:COX15-CtaA-domain-containing protein [Rhizopogon vinicolor AM-OR11-026]